MAFMRQDNRRTSSATRQARPTADGTLAYNQKLAASIMKKKKKGQ